MDVDLEAGRQTLLVLNGVELDLDAGLLRHQNGTDIALRAQSLAVLKHLAINPGRVVTKDELLDTVWPGIAVTENSLSQCISEIRKAIGDESQMLLKTVARRGYRLVLPVHSDSARANVANSPHETSNRRKRIFAILAALIVVGCITILFWTSGRPAAISKSLSIAVTDWRRYLKGLAAFGEERYEDAIATIEELDIGSGEPWSKFYAMHLLTAAYGHLGRQQETIAAKEKLKAVVKEVGEGEPNLLIAQQFFVYKQPADIARLVDGLRLAGVAEMPSGMPASINRLDGLSIGRLVFGHQLLGRLLRPKIVLFKLTATLTGQVTQTLGNKVTKGHMWLQGDALCSGYPKLLTECGYVFRSPAGSPAHQNEYRYYTRFNDYEFSVGR